jgi:hypothetical protein
MQMDNDQLKTIKTEIRNKFDELIEQYNLDWKDELKILSMLTDDLSKNLVGTVTIISK